MKDNKFWRGKPSKNKTRKLSYDRSREREQNRRGPWASNVAAKRPDLRQD